MNEYSHLKDRLKNPFLKKGFESKINNEPLDYKWCDDHSKGDVSKYPDYSPSMVFDTVKYENGRNAAALLIGQGIDPSEFL